MRSQPINCHKLSQLNIVASDWLSQIYLVYTTDETNEINSDEFSVLQKYTNMSCLNLNTI